MAVIEQAVLKIEPPLLINKSSEIENGGLSRRAYRALS
jgi:hypothetical protein